MTLQSNEGLFQVSPIRDASHTTHSVPPFLRGEALLAASEPPVPTLADLAYYPSTLVVAARDVDL
jgi:hypothetical protein